MAFKFRLLHLLPFTLVLLQSADSASSSPLPLHNVTSRSDKSLKTRGLIANPDPNDWIPFDSVGMMLPVKVPGVSQGEKDKFPCTTVECEQHMNYMTPDSSSLPPGVDLGARDLSKQRSRDLVRRQAAVAFDKETGQPSYQFMDEPDEPDEPDSDDADEPDEPDEIADGYENSKQADAKNTEDADGRSEEGNKELVERHLPAFRGISVLGTPNFSRRSDSFLTRLFKRKKYSSSKDSEFKSGEVNTSKRKKGEKKKAKDVKKSAKENKPKKGKKKNSEGKLGLDKLDLMKGATILTTITWYTGIDLLNPFCDRKTKWTPTDDSLIVAVTEKWSLRPACGEFMEITTQDGKKDRSIIARVVDLCGGCIPEVPHADLSKAAFKLLYDLDVGRVHGLKMRRVPPPKRWDNKLYGPKEL